jgi:2-polyprenyl-6-methoxyphenol hydroxylase-like FAD-dependent oxidoreductase
MAHVCLPAARLPDERTEVRKARRDAVSGIGVVGAGISGLSVALRLHQYGMDVTLYAERTAEAVRASPLPNSVIRFHPARERERALGVDHWEFPDFGVSSIHMNVLGPQPLAFVGNLSHQASGVDFRIYLARLLEDFERRGGRVVTGPLDEAGIVSLAGRHDLVVVASGGRAVTALFPRVERYSPFAAPQRVLCSGLYTGIALPDPTGVAINIAPGIGEIFQAPFFSFHGRVSVLLFEAVPGGPMDVLARLRYQDDPRHFESTVLHLLERYAPAVRSRVDTSRFGLTRPADLLQGALTPVVRRAWTRLGDGRYALAVGDAWVLNDPIAGQGANLGSHSAWTLAEAIVAGPPYGEDFCRDVERRMWPFAEAVTNFSNALLGAPTPQLVELLGKAAGNPAVADALLDNFADPPAMWDAIGTPEGASRFLAPFLQEAR